MSLEDDVRNRLRELTRRIDLLEKANTKLAESLHGAHEYIAAARQFIQHDRSCAERMGPCDCGLAEFRKEWEEPDAS